MPREGEGAVVRQGRCIALVVAFLIGCALLLMADASGVLAEASQQNKHKRTEATNNEQTHSPKATASEEAKCEGTRKINVNLPGRFTTNDLPGCPKGGLLSGTEKGDALAGEKGDDEVRGLGGSDEVWGGDGNDVLYGGPGKDAMLGDNGDDVLYGGPGDDFNLTGDEGNDVIHGGPGDDHYFRGSKGEDVIYGGPGDDTKLNGGGLGLKDGQRDKLYCGEGRDTYYAEKTDYVSSSCEVKLGNSAPGPSASRCQDCGGYVRHPTHSTSAPASASPALNIPPSGGAAILLPAAALLLGSGILTYVILRRR